jgi:hypothetical protein
MIRLNRFKARWGIRGLYYFISVLEFHILIKKNFLKYTITISIKPLTTTLQHLKPWRESKPRCSDSESVSMTITPCRQGKLLNYFVLLNNYVLLITSPIIEKFEQIQFNQLKFLFMC